MLVLIPLFALFSSAHSCMATSPGTVPLSCKNCLMTALTVTQAGIGAKPFAVDFIDRTGTCATRRLRCEGVDAAIDMNQGRGVQMMPGNGVAEQVLTCTTAGTWVVAGINEPIRFVECASA